MPHQLRRIITINIRNPNGGLPSGRIAELDPRGGVLAVGVNGVGKTTFLRFLPLFYGATPQQILRGTGRTLMIKYALPDPSSAVAYEYERESETDLRTVVMHCKPGDDAPQFHIIRGGYREDFFYDANNQFVTREEFKAHVEAMDNNKYQVSQKLYLHQYRSVILNERLATKEGVKMRELAAMHSLGPSPLYNLDQIAAAMANEKISFRDLENIVIERVTDAHFDGNVPNNSREIKKSRGDVARWLEDRDHLARIMANRPEALKIQARIETVKTLHLELCTLHVAVKEAIVQIAREQEEFDARQARLKSEFDTKTDDINTLIAAATGDKKTADTAWANKREEVEAAESRLRQFEKIGVEKLAAEQSQEDSCSSQRSAMERELDGLTTAAGDVTRKTQARKAAVASDCADVVSRINERLLEASREGKVRGDELHAAEENALEALESPLRIAEINDAKLLLISRLGELKVLLASPTATSDTLEQQRQSVSAVDHMREALGKATASVLAAQDELAVARGASDIALVRLNDCEQAALQLAQRDEQLQEQLSPPAGSLLAFLRSTDAALWSDSAKVIDTALLSRTDLNPALVDGSAPSPGELTLGSVTLHVERVDVPSWVDMTDVRQQISALKREADVVSKALQDARSSAQRLSKEMSLANVKVGEAKAGESLAKAALENARLTQIRWTNVMEQEKLACTQQTESEQRKNVTSVQKLDAEANLLLNGLKAAKQHIRDDFRAQRRAVVEETSAAEARLDQEKATAYVQRDRHLSQIDEDMARDLAGLGVDPIRVADLARGIEDFTQRLENIARNRHEVTEWRRFQRETFPVMESTRLERDRLATRCSEINSKLLDLRGDLTRLEESTRLDLANIERNRESNRKQADRLTELLRLGLKDFMSYVPNRLHVDWNVESLEAAVSDFRDKLAGESEAIQKELRNLKNVMLMRSGPVEHWLSLKERELPDKQTLLDHEWQCALAQVVCDWFDPREYVPYVDQVHKEMVSFLDLAGGFVRTLDLFDRRVDSFNRELQKALSETAKFERFRDLSVTVRSGVGQISSLKTLRQMQDVANSKGSLHRSVVVQEREVPSDEETALIREFRNILPSDGVFMVNLNDQVRLECSLIENGQRKIITNEDEFRAVSSSGNTALITAMFLIGFVQMIRGPNSPVRLTWVTDEIGRFDPDNLAAFLHTLDWHKIDVISASPSVDPALARYFPRLCVFENNGSIWTSETQVEGEAYVDA